MWLARTVAITDALTVPRRPAAAAKASFEGAKTVNPLRVSSMGTTVGVYMVRAPTREVNPAATAVDVMLAGTLSKEDRQLRPRGHRRCHLYSREDGGNDVDDKVLVGGGCNRGNVGQSLDDRDGSSIRREDSSLASSTGCTSRDHRQQSVPDTGCRRLTEVDERGSRERTDGERVLLGERRDGERAVKEVVRHDAGNESGVGEDGGGEGSKCLGNGEESVPLLIAGASNRDARHQWAQRRCGCPAGGSGGAQQRWQLQSRGESSSCRR
jgi:hypothetical protein